MDEKIQKAAKEVAKAWTNHGPSPIDHIRAREHLRGVWPSLATAVDKLAAVVGETEGWEYNVEELNLETGERKLVSINWNERWAEKESLRQTLDKYEQTNIEYGGKRRKEFKVVKRRKPEGYVDA